MSSKLKGVMVALVAVASLAGSLAPASAAAIGTGSLALRGGDAAMVQQVGYWYRGRWYGGSPGPNGAAVGAGIALGILGAAAIAGAASAPPPVYYEPPPPVYYEPAPRVYLEGPPPPRPRSCWVDAGPGRGYWSPC
mgnify:CR=1 FL=1